jgi:hypothetical protein
MNYIDRAIFLQFSMLKVCNRKMLHLKDINTIRYTPVVHTRLLPFIKKMKIILISLVLIFGSIKSYCQYGQIVLETDSTEIEISKNSVYWILEESYKNKDSIFRSVRFIHDTTQVNVEGWQRKDGEPFGKWNEYTIDGTWLYTIDYTNHSWIYNKDEYKFQSIKDSIKAKADLILIDMFGKEFFDNNVVFQFYGQTAIGSWKNYEGVESWSTEKRLGSWIEPIEQKPNFFDLDYSIKLSKNELYHDMLELRLDSTGNLIQQSSSFEMSFEDIMIQHIGKFKISRELAIQLCKDNKLKESVNEYDTRLRFGWRKMDEYSGKFYYEVTQQYEEIIDGDCKPNCTITGFFNVWRFDPWTNELFFNKSMKKIMRLNNGCLVSDGYTELNE